MTQLLQRAKLLFAEASVIQNLANAFPLALTGLHCDIGLPLIGITKSFVVPTLSYFSNPARINLARSSRAECGSRKFELSDQRSKEHGAMSREQNKHTRALMRTTVFGFTLSTLLLAFSRFRRGAAAGKDPADRIRVGEWRCQQSWI